jgi:phosphatidylglycerophosphate synthase
MSSTAVPAAAALSPAPGRPMEIEEWSNRRLIHPISRALVGVLIPTGVSPNAVSAAGAVMAALAACAFVLLPWPVSALAGFLFLVAWHVFDGADGDLARRTGRTSINGELVDGLCDHLGQAAIYLAFALMLVDDLGISAFVLPLASGLSRAVQASAYEACRRNYRRWVYDARWIRQTLAVGEQPAARGWTVVKLATARAYVAVARLVSADDGALESAMERLTAGGGDAAAEARRLYRERMLPLVKQASVLCANYRSLAAFLSVLAGAPLAFVLYELAALNLVLVWLRLAEGRANHALVAALTAADPDLSSAGTVRVS